jgi:hypothetical protein
LYGEYCIRGYNVFGEQSHTLLSEHLLYAMMMNCENVEHAIRKNFQYHNLIMDIIRPMIKVKKTLAYLTWEMGDPALAPERHLSESVLALFVSMLRFLTGDQFKLTEVRFTHPCPGNTAEHERISIDEAFLDVTIFRPASRRRRRGPDGRGWGSGW